MFKAVLPYYLSIGMTNHEFWDEDSELVIAYREADERRLERANYEMWLQGLYIYQAIGAIAPALGFNPKKPEKYMEKPIPITKSAQEADEKSSIDKFAMGLIAWAQANDPTRGKKNG
ncbi:MAG TPA: hypothetical protein P5092_17200 [Ruminococcus sp.]|nr:hypothetical protein [Ruminococcus sp.]